MPGGRARDDSEGAATPHLSLWQRFVLALPHAKRDTDKAPLGERLKGALVKPPDPDAPAEAPAKPETVEEIEEAIRVATDKERLIGLLAAPIGAMIGLLVTSALIDTHRKHPTVYAELGGILIVLSVAMLVSAWMRKRTILGFSMALYGLDMFNLHYWGFGVPFLLFGSWLLARAWGLRRDLKEATGAGPAGPGPGPANGSRPRPNKRYTPPT
jgi:hypothetical protein